MNRATPSVDFDNLETAFAGKSTTALLKAGAIFGLMNSTWLVQLSSRLALWAVKHRLPLVNTVIKHTVFNHFCGGTSLPDCQLAINRLANQNVATILDYGGEAKQTEQDFNSSMEEIIHALDFSAGHQNIAVVSIKLTALAPFALLEKMQAKTPLSPSEREERQKLTQRLSFIGQKAKENKVALFVDAEESWIQASIDEIVLDMQRRYNQEAPIVYNTFQMYRHDRLAYLKKVAATAEAEGFILCAKLVRGAYLEKERARAQRLNYPSPIQVDKAATDRDYNSALAFCIKHYQRIAFYNASHNMESALLQADWMQQHHIPREHPNLNFCQLYGMGDHITFNLARAGFNAMKYMPYGQINEVIPYLIRRAEENTAMSGEMSREYQLVKKELERRRSK